MLRIIHTADLHLGISFSNISNSPSFENIRFQDFFKNFEYIKDYAIKNKADLFIIAGDIFHNPRPSIEAFNAFSKIIGDLIKNGIQVVVTLGNHDSSKTREALSYLKSYVNVGLERFILFDVASKKIIALHNGEKVKIIGLPYPHFQSAYSYQEFVSFFENKLQELKSNDTADYMIVVGHIFVEGGKIGSEQRIASLRDHPIPKRLFKDVDVACLGHLHTPQELDSNILYSGSIERIDFGEENEEKSFLDIILGSKLEFKRIPLKLRPMKTFYLNFENASINEISDKIKALKLEEDSIVRLRIEVSKTTNISASYIDKIIRENFKLAGYKIEITRKKVEETRLAAKASSFNEYLENYLRTRYKKSDEWIRNVIEEANRIIEEVRIKK
jgi:exonuclease SbcD